MSFQSLQFKHPWRPYQKRVLDAVRQHLNDNRLHVVAAPGAGKTSLGLEVFRMLAKPALVLSPTRIIRDQWLERLEDFCEGSDVTQLDWVSKSIKSPKILTSITYQALHAKFADELSNESDEQEFLVNEKLPDSEINRFIQTLKENGIEVLILDEAHHLRAEWWRALQKVCDHFPDIVVVSLTATPPYDSQGHEWLRYEQLCGPIDEEISVPELVKSGTLCPHQDYLWACDITATEKQQIQEYDSRVTTLCKTLFDSSIFEDIVLSHPWLDRDDDEIENDIIKAPEIAIVILSFTKAKAIPANERFMMLLDLTSDDIPDLGRRSWQLLVETILFSQSYQHNEQQQVFIDQLKKQLRASELLKKRELSLERSRRLDRASSLSPSKIEACLSIHKLEYKQRQQDLCQVFLTDYIRDEALKSGLNTGELNLGAWPLFKRMTETSPIPDQIGLLTGRLCIIPSNKLDLLLNTIDSQYVKKISVDRQTHYTTVTGTTNKLTTAFTALLMNGDLKVLIGTRSLLGEGWDAPAINSLVLASAVGSFMLTNQMRGRAIRVNRNNKDKISSIWHLVAINNNTHSHQWSDYRNLKQRFDTFVGLSEKTLTIESGFNRMNATGLENADMRFESPRLTITKPVARNNRQMIRRYRQIQKSAKRWNEALTINATAKVIPTVSTNKQPQLRGYLLKHALGYLVTQIMLAILAVFSLLEYIQFDVSLRQYLYFLGILVFGVLIYNLPKTLSILKIVFLYLPVDGALKQISKALLNALSEAGFIETSIRRINSNAVKLPDGSFYIYISGCTFYESSLFSDCMAELLGPVDNPRYLIVREGKFLVQKRNDYHAVPLKFAVKKETAMIFYKNWSKYVSPSELIYTRSPDGRKSLLKAKMKAFSSVFKNEVKRLDRWQ